MSSTAEMIMWFGVFLAVGIIFAWMFMNIKTVGEYKVSTLEDDAKLFTNIFTDICYVDEYQYNFTDVSEDYKLEILNYSLCLKAKEMEVCKKTACPTNVNVNLTINKYDIILFEKTNGITQVSVI